MEDVACGLDNVSPITDLSRNLNTLRPLSSDAGLGTPTMPVKLAARLAETPDSASSFRLKSLTPASEPGASDSEAEPSPLTSSLHRRAVLGQMNRSLHESPLLINRAANSRRALRRMSQELRDRSAESPYGQMRKNSSQGYCSSGSDGFALEEVLIEEDVRDKENCFPVMGIANLLSAPLTSGPSPTQENGSPAKKASSSARRNLSFTNANYGDTPIKGKRGNEEERGSSKRTRTSRCLVERSCNIVPKIPKFFSESNIDRSAAETVIDKSGPDTVIPTSGAHKSCALPTITAQTMSDLLTGKYEDVVASIQIIDCRWPYEYDAGHIKGALNLYTHELVFRQFLEKTPEDADVERDSSKKNLVIFHCEFSSERGPKMSQYLRERDREANVYPKLFYPEVYILQGGYKEFFHRFKEHCFPQEYQKMVDERFAKECRLYRSQSKNLSKKALARIQSSRF